MTFTFTRCSGINAFRMRPLPIILGLLSTAVFAQPALQVNEAIALAESNHPSLRIARAESDAALAVLQESRVLLWNNPLLTAEARQRSLSQVQTRDASRRDAGVGVFQTFETGGQPAARRVAARASLSASQATVEATRREVRAEAARRFFRVLALQQRVKAETEALQLLQRAARMVSKRVRAGEDSRLDGNLAVVESERSANQLSLVKEQLSQARAALATTLQLPPGALPAVAGELAVAAPAYSQDDLLDAASRQPRLQAAGAIEEAARGRLALERAARSPDVTVGLSYGAERGIDTRDRITTLSVSVPLPLFHRNEGAIGRALSDLERSRVDQRSTAREIESTVRLLWQQQASLQSRTKRLRESVLTRLTENQRLSFKALQAGAIGLGQYLLARRQTLDAQRELLDATTDLLLTRVDLEAAGGWPESLPPIGLPAGSHAR